MYWRMCEIYLFWFFLMKRAVTCLKHGGWSVQNIDQGMCKCFLTLKTLELQISQNSCQLKFMSWTNCFNSIDTQFWVRGACFTKFATRKQRNASWNNILWIITTHFKTNIVNVSKNCDWQPFVEKNAAADICKQSSRFAFVGTAEMTGNNQAPFNKQFICSCLRETEGHIMLI